MIIPIFREKYDIILCTGLRGGLLRDCGFIILELSVNVLYVS